MCLFYFSWEGIYKWSELSLILHNLLLDPKFPRRVDFAYSLIIIFCIFSCFHAVIHVIFSAWKTDLSSSICLSQNFTFLFKSHLKYHFPHEKFRSPSCYLKLWKHNLWILLCYNLPPPYNMVIYVLELFLLKNFTLLGTRYLLGLGKASSHITLQQILSVWTKDSSWTPSPQISLAKYIYKNPNVSSLF